MEKMYFMRVCLSQQEKEGTFCRHIITILLRGLPILPRTRPRTQHILKKVCVCIGKEEHMRFLCLSYNVNIQTKIRTTQYAKYETIFIHEISKVSRRSRAESGLIVYCDVNSLSGVFECLIVMF